MNKADLNAKYRDYAKNNLSPTLDEQKMVTRIYDAIKVALGDKCLLIGSYARFTAGRPLHDVDVLFVAGNFNPSTISPQSVLMAVQNAIREKFTNPTSYELRISPQSHSITVSFLEGGKERFGVDIVPAFVSGVKNEFGDDIYWVPEILLVSRQKRRSRYDQLAKTKRSEIEWWLRSDPRGYIRATTEMNAQNAEFRKAAKIIKRWKHNCCSAYDDFKLKSFHVEQVLFGLYQQNPNIELADAIFEFFVNVPSTISQPQVRDRADQAKFIDDYLNELTGSEKQRVIEARDFFLIKLENLAEKTSIADLLQAGSHKRSSNTEEYLFDHGIPVFLDREINLKITANVLPRNGGFRGFVLDTIGFINVDRKIQFAAKSTPTSGVDLLKWKVKNDNNSPQPRGEITDHSTRNNPESTKYNGSHFVECYAIRDGVCVSRARQNVVLKFIGT